ncbi:LEAF RUST 10 DISEASE-RESISTANCEUS RECEPTOR-LIKE PROTEIN KINASE-like 1.2 isoform X2 [Typha latifolia]|uniref:LEAF RUST 10 DISEASE-RESISTANCEUS RECEPTOR-LIKE PROTEIN KINASE-like 1.2 isoform X2 n=1 Tax=Typha latifolia TaxID=4733 RepID=UPI003C2FBCC6
MPMPMPSRNPLLSLLLLLPLSMIPSHGSPLHDTYGSPSPSIPASPVNSTSCAPYRCGNVSISYPFYLSEAPTIPPQYCGFPGMGVFCDNGRTPILLTQSGNYTITNIDYGNRTVFLADTDVYNARNSSCLRVQHNLTFFSNSWLEYTPSDAYLAFFFNCSPTILNAEPIGCLSGNQCKAFVFPTNASELEYGPDWAHTCLEIVVAPVLDKDPITVSNLMNGYGELLKSGFQLTWPEQGSDDCKSCEQSGGRCGFNQTSTTYWVPSCFCSDGLHPHVCGKGKSKMGVIIGVAVGAAVFLLGLVCIALYIRKKRRPRSPSSKFLTRSFQSEPYPTDLESSSLGQQTHVFSYEELEKATNRFDSSKELGSGGFGNVYKGELRDGRTVAIKRLFENNYNRIEQFLNEVSILSRLRHQNLVCLYGCTSRHSREYLLVYEYVPNGTIADHLHGPRATERALTWPVRLNIAIETADALAYLHAIEPPIIHRDVKSNNILLDVSYHVKVADFGLSRLFPLDVTHVSTAPQGTPGYVDPEYHKCYQLTDKSDVYSFGVVLVELISSKPAVDLCRRRDEINLANMAINKIQKCELDQLVDPELGYESNWATKKMITMVAELAFRCLQPDGDMRPPIKEVLEVLKGIEKEGFRGEKGGEGDVGMDDDDGLLKNIPPFSPDSVTAKWVSRSTTPNTST